MVGFDGARLCGVRCEDELDALGADGAVDLSRVLALRDQLLERAVGRPRRLLHLPTLHNNCQLSRDVNKYVIISTGALLCETSFMTRNWSTALTALPALAAIHTCCRQNQVANIVLSWPGAALRDELLDEQLVNRIDSCTCPRRTAQTGTVTLMQE